MDLLSNPVVLAGIVALALIALWAAGYFDRPAAPASHAPPVDPLEAMDPEMKAIYYLELSERRGAAERLKAGGGRQKLGQIAGAVSLATEDAEPAPKRTPRKAAAKTSTAAKPAAKK